LGELAAYFAAKKTSAETETKPEEQPTTSEGTPETKQPKAP
jgi:hypothetical protein